MEKAKDKTFEEKQLNEIDPSNFVEYYRKMQDNHIQLNFKMISNYFNHKECLRLIKEDESDKNTYHIVLEDDVLCFDNSYKKLKSLLKNL